jgi:hypothetical protein
MDHRALLLRYMAHVMDGAGTSYIDATGATIRLTPEEVAELRKVETEARVLLRR